MSRPAENGPLAEDRRAAFPFLGRKARHQTRKKAGDATKAVPDQIRDEGPARVGGVDVNGQTRHANVRLPGEGSQSLEMTKFMTPCSQA